MEQGAKLCREHKIDVILAVGGGSTIDCSKAIAAATFYEGNAWDMIKSSTTGGVKISKVLPICTVLTLAATGSETNSGAVISNMQTKEKLPFFHQMCLPKCSILEPENTFTVPRNQTAAGAADIMSHIFEVYFTDNSSYIPDRISESLLKSVIKYTPIAMAQT